MDVSLRKLINILGEYNKKTPPRIINEAARIIGNYVDISASTVTKTPDDAKKMFESMFSEITITSSPISETDIRSTDSKTYTYYRGDEERVSQMIDSVRVTGSKVELTGPNVTRRRIEPTADGKYIISENIHNVSYVKCHIGGFTKYVRAGNVGKVSYVKPHVGTEYGPSPINPDINTGWVKGRDVIYSSVLMAKQDILKNIRDDIMKKAKWRVSKANERK